jgi:sterol desaturase/sphingolipid hydroxylase (fatty acid hydroxylase superfamily)
MCLQPKSEEAREGSNAINDATLNKSTSSSSSTSSSTSASSSIKQEIKNSDKPQTPYSWAHPDENLKMKDHFSSLLFGGSIVHTIMEFALLAAPFIIPKAFTNASFDFDVKGSMPLNELATFFVICAIVRRFYNTYLESVYFSFPKLRIQPASEHRLKQKKDLMGRDKEQLHALYWHDMGTMLSQFVLNFGLYYLLPGFYPAASPEGSEKTFQQRFISLILNHYVMSFGMYWAHRSLHVVPFLWEHIHSFHHWAKHPLSRNTYEDHWLDNFANAIIGHTFAQILIPLDRPTFYFSRIFRILESLEKHSGVSCGFNLAYSMQQWLPFAQMPHHHDWHHEGFKGSNYTFSSIGGLWDCLFGTRKGGRWTANNAYAATREDKAKDCNKIILPSWFSPIFPLVGLSAAVGMKLKEDGVF